LRRRIKFLASAIRCVLHDVKHFTPFEDGVVRQIRSQAPLQKSIDRSQKPISKFETFAATHQCATQIDRMRSVLRRFSLEA
jgi:hypothetical protein